MSGQPTSERSTTADQAAPIGWPLRMLLILLSLLLHAALLAWLLSERFSRPVVEASAIVAVELIEMPAPEPEPEPVPEPEPEPEPVRPPPAPRPSPSPAPRQPVAADPAAPPSYAFGANQDWAAPPTPSVSADIGTRARLAPSGYADTVKNRVIAHLQRPEGSVYKPPPGYRGDPNDFKRQCYIPYEIVVDANGRMQSYTIDRCGDELLDAAAERAILNAGPFPPPPGGSGQVTIYGTAIFIK
ncbi:hypothetical protein CK507_16030 [Pseudomonas sp. WN033]|nr:hypothetical protein CK507_16030 [Pseudomonas sp. WN033]